MLTHFRKPVLLVVVMLALCMATLATNIAANVVNPANDFAQLAPKHITFRIGGFITGVVGILMVTIKLLANPESYIFQWLGGYGALLGQDRRDIDRGLFRLAQTQARPRGALPARRRISLRQRLRLGGNHRACDRNFAEPAGIFGARASVEPGERAGVAGEPL